MEKKLFSRLVSGSVARPLSPSTHQLFSYSRTAASVHDILVWIRIRGSMPLTNGSGSGSGFGLFLFSLLTFNLPTKTNLKKQFFCILIFKGTFTSFFKGKSQKEVTIQ
jgi:hypothetical protein